jgi:hypothetical protein
MNRREKLDIFRRWKMIRLLTIYLF